MSVASLSSLDDLLACLYDQGHTWYGQERITQLQHACQCAHLAQKTGCEDTLVVAAFLHDIAHLTHANGEDCAERGLDDHHERAGARLLARWFSREVTEPIRLHVDAKRYLCVAEPEYFEHLSPASRLSLNLQGGAFSVADAVNFASQAGAADAVRLRRWDDLAKDPDAQVPDFGYFVAIVRRVAAGMPPDGFRAASE